VSLAFFQLTYPSFAKTELPNFSGFPLSDCLFLWLDGDWGNGELRGCRMPRSAGRLPPPAGSPDAGSPFAGRRLLLVRRTSTRLLAARSRLAPAALPPVASLVEALGSRTPSARTHAAATGHRRRTSATLGCSPAAAATSCESVVNRTVARRPISVSADGGEIVRNYWASGLWTQYVICLLLGYLPSDGPLKLMKKGPGKNKRPGCLQPPPRRLLDAPSPSFPSLMAECFLGG